MGDPKKQKKTYSGPSHPWQKTRIDLEAVLKKKYGYKNKKELWKFTSKLRDFRSQARNLIPRIATNQGKVELNQLFTKLQSYGLIGEKPTIDEVLQLSIEDLLDRRLQTLVYKKGFTNTVGQARQFIVHGHVTVDGQIVTSPARMMKKGEEPKINVDEAILKTIKRKENLKTKKEVEKIKEHEEQNSRKSGNGKDGKQSEQ